jgi:hypothetical protein
MSKRNSLPATSTFHRAIALVITATCALVLTSQKASADTTVFDDTFNNGSTVDQAPTAPTANSASYEVAGNQTLGTAPSITPGDFNLTFNNTSSAFTEMMAQFTTSPLTLVNIGDSIDLTVTFVNTSHVLTAGDTGSRLDIGLYSSGGVAPLQGAMNLNSGTSFDSGGAAGWQGMYAEARTATGASVGVRLPQSAPNGSVQDLLFNGASTGVAFGNPPGETLATSTSTASIGLGTTNTFEIRLTLTGASSMAVSNTLYAGAGTGGTVLYSLNGTTNGVINSFDSMAFGWRFSGTKTISVGDLQEVKVTDNLVPEPSTIALVGAAIAMIPFLRRRRRS